VGQITGLQVEQDRLAALQLVDVEGAPQQLPLDFLVPVLGISPRLGPVADWGLAMERKQLVVDTEAFRTSVPGIHAVGDINTYPGKRKLILCGFHEATLAAFGAAEFLSGAKVPLQYTTTSARLHQLLGVAPAA
jgi:thioredoxin reductase (NADPH)